MKVSSAFKVGLLTIVSLSILVFSLMWVKGRTLSSGARYVIQMKDVNGIREGSAVQMMGLRIGQIEEIRPVVNEHDSYVELKFAITEPKITIPKASQITIQQSGIIGEQFLEISPPKLRHIFIPIKNKKEILKSGDKIRMLLDDKIEDVGIIKSMDILETDTLPLPLQSRINNKYAYKVTYIIDLPGLFLPEQLNGKIITEGETTYLKLIPFNNIRIPYPYTKSQYTIIEPLRISDFMELQYRSAYSLNETNERISAILTDDVIEDLKETAANLNSLIVKTESAVDKAEMLIEASKKDLEYITSSINLVTEQVVSLTSNLNGIVSNNDFKTSFATTTESINRLSSNLNRLLEDESTAEVIENLNVTLKNVSEISAYLNDFTKDDKVSANLKDAIVKLNCVLDELAITLDAVNEIAVEDKQKIRATINDAASTSRNLRKFSDKLNKRFLLFRLMF